MADALLPTPLSRFASNGSVGIHYLDSAAASPRPDTGQPSVVFVPGLTDVADDYVTVIGEFGLRTIVIDLRGRGHSDTPADGYALEDHVGDIEAAVADAGIEQFHLATFSRGTAYGLAFAFAHPERVLTVTIGDYHAREIGLPATWSERFLQGRWRGEPVADRISEQALNQIARESVERPFWNDLGALRVPVLVIRSGRLGRGGQFLVDDDALDRYRAAVPGVEFATFDESGHDLFRPDPTRYPRLVASFTARREPA